MKRYRTIYIDQILTFILLMGMLAMCVKPTLAQCPNDFCDTATDLTLCVLAPFDNYDCTDEQMCVGPHPHPPHNCSYNYQYKSQWFTFTVAEGGLYTLELATNYIGDIEGWNNCTGTFQGSQWALMKGSCDGHILNSVNFNSQHLCFCPGSPWPTGEGAWAGDCSESPCGQTYPIGPYWQSVGMMPQDIDSDPPYLPYVPCKNYHHVEFFLEPDTYYIQITSVGLSEGDGTIELCGPWGPLSTKPELFYRNSRLEWEGETQTDWAVFQFINLNWTEIARTYNRQLEINESGYYIVAGSSGFSNPVHVEFPAQTRSWGFNVIGQETNKMMVK